MVAISLKFPAGRYHATPWQRHVNEGAVEWPPAPWRILRALVAVWRRTLPDLPQEQVEPILRALVDPPEFVLPPASTGHTRHYMPWFKKGPDDRTLVFDTFVAVPREAVVQVRWPGVSLTDAQLETLSRIVGNLNTLGRSESWCVAELASESANHAGSVCHPLEKDLPRGHEIVRVLCADLATAFEDKHVVITVRRNVGRGKNRQEVEERSTIYDPAWNLCMETLQLHKDGWSDPPGSRWVPYMRPKQCFNVEPRLRARVVVERPRVQVIRYAVDSAVLPLVTETLPVAEAARRALMSLHGRLTERNGTRGRSTILSGKNEDGLPLLDHRHTYYLPTDEDGDGRIDHLTVYAADGFGAEERRALDRLRTLRTGREGEERHPLRLLLLGMAGSEEYSPGPLRPSEVWISATPYIATRYAKTTGRNRIDIASPQDRAAFLQDNLRAQLAAVRRDIASDQAQDVTIDPMWDENHGFHVAGRWRILQFKRFRRKDNDDGGRRLAGAFRLTFRRPVGGPLSLGHSSHFGMGLFQPVEYLPPNR